MNRDYTYCVGACEPLCNHCKRHCLLGNPTYPNQLWWMTLAAKNNKCINFDPKNDEPSR